MINSEKNDLYDLNEALKVENLTTDDYEEICKQVDDVNLWVHEEMPLNYAQLEKIYGNGKPFAELVNTRAARDIQEVVLVSHVHQIHSGFT